MSKYVLPKALRELRFFLSQTGEASAPLKKFLTNDYANLKSLLNNKIPILIREAYGVPPSLTARFERGREVQRNLVGLDEKGIQNAVNDILKA